MTGQQLKNYRRRMKMNREALAFWLGVDPNTVFRWERGVQRVPDAVEVVLKSTPRPREGWKWMDACVLAERAEPGHKDGLFLYDSENRLHISRTKYGDIIYSRDGYTWSEDLYTVLDEAPGDVPKFANTSEERMT